MPAIIAEAAWEVSLVQASARSWAGMGVMGVRGEVGWRGLV